MTARIIGYHTMLALRAADIRNKKPPRDSFGGTNHRVIRLAANILALVAAALAIGALRILGL
jgi:hypothetical protein